MDQIVRTLWQKQSLAKLVGAAPAFLKSIEHLPAVARSDAPVLITGETGTGKELVARAVHYLSERAAFPFIPMNCGAFPDPLMEVELFGHERGAFTDAHTRRPGLMAGAEGGTLFLDEVDTLPAKAQIDLLRVLQDKSYRIVGGSHERRINVRVLAASNAPLLLLAKSGSFRLDLYFRLCVFSLNLPALRERAQDIPALAEHFLQKHVPADRTGLKLTREALTELMFREWPGNVRELENAIIRGIHLSSGDTIEAADLSLSPRGEGPSSVRQEPLGNLRDFRTMKREIIQSFEKTYLTKLMAECKGNVSLAARAAGKERRDLGKLLKKYQLNVKGFNPPSTAAG